MNLAYKLLKLPNYKECLCRWELPPYNWCYIRVTRSRKIESDSDYQKNKERVQELKVLWKREKQHSKIDKYIIETLTFTRLQALFLEQSLLRF